MPVVALSLGYASHLAGDACTRTGIPLLYPRRTHYHLLPHRTRVVTGSEYEELFFATENRSGCPVRLRRGGMSED
jgi:membrane-bound metal-dependent hydrolase YbcI (DUF457 family)